MATKALNLANDQQTTTDPEQNLSGKDENIRDDDTNNNAQMKVLPILKIHEPFSKNSGQDTKESTKPSHQDESLVTSELRDDGLKAPTSKNWTLENDLKTEMSKSSKHHSRNLDDVPGSSRNSAVLPLLTLEPVKDESSHESEKDFSHYFSQSVSAAGSKVSATGGESSKLESERAKSGNESESAEVFGSSQLSTMLEKENGAKNRQKTGAQVPSQAAPVKPRCTPAREAVDPAKYFTLTDEPDGTKYACSKCGNVYKWRKSLNKHWKEKHDGEAPSLHARPPPSLLQRERFLSPIRGAPRHSSFHQPGFYGSGIHSKSSSATPVISPPRLHTMHVGKNAHSTSPYHFGKFPPIKEDGRETGKGVHQTEEPATAVVRPNRSSQSPVAFSRWSNWLSSANAPALDLPLPHKLKIPTVGPIKSAHDYTQSRDNFGQLFSAIKGQHTARGGPLDLSGTLVSRSSNDDDNILDLSRKGSLDVFSSAYDCTTSVQDEPLDFSTKYLSKSSGYSKTIDATPSDSFFSSNWFHVTDKKASPIPKAVDFSDVAAESKSSLISIDDLDKPGQVLCACCKLRCKTVAELNHHFARNHASVLYETSGDVSGVGHHNIHSRAQSPNISGNQLLKYLTWEKAKKSLSCVVCGISVQWSWMLGKHFEQMHSSIQPNPYKRTSSISAVTSSDPDFGAGLTPLVPNHRCEICSYSTDSAAEFFRHQLKHSLAKENKEQELRSNNRGYLQIPDDDRTKDLTMKYTAGSTLNKFTDEIIDLEGENTAIVIPQAPEETYLGSSTGKKYQGDVGSPSDSPSAFGKLSYETGLVLSEENTAIVIPQAPEETSVGSSPAYSTPSGSQGCRSKKDAGLSTESLLPFKCELCEYRARWPSEMMQHMKNHSDEKPYQCPQCSYRSKWKWDVVKHLKRCGGGGSVKDVIDTTTIKKKSYVKSLLNDAHSHQSAYDGSSPYGSLSFPRFYEQSNVLKARDSLARASSDFTVYSEMNEMNDSSEGMDNHENCDSEDTVSEDLSVGKSEPDNNEPSQNNHACPQCPFVGHSPAELKRHLRVHSDEKPYSCQTCNYSSKWKCDLKKHLKAYNHDSAVPLSSGSHGKKPVTWSQITRQTSDSDGKTAKMVDGDLKFLLQGVHCGKGSKKPLWSDSGNIFGGITSGGRLKCKQCEFEAIDITSFLQHKKMHRNGETVVRNAVKSKSHLPSHHHRRKSFKQTRVVPAVMGGKESSVKSNRNLNVTDVVELEERSPETKRFWDSLGLQSINSVNRKRRLSLGESDENYEDPDSSDPELQVSSVHCGSSSKCARYHLSEHPEFMKQFSQTSSNSYESNSDMEIEQLEGNELGQCQARTKNEMEAETMAEAEKFTDSKAKEMKASGCSLIIKNPLQTIRRGMRQGVTTTEAEDAAGMSKRKRKLRTCEKCGYITDNLTTLQRHAAKHGSGGRHRCWMCDYSVDRQHVLEYHMKIVHEGANRRAENKAEDGHCEEKSKKLNTDEKRMSLENFARDIEPPPAFDREVFGGKRRIVCTTSVITVRGHEMEMIQKGNKTWYNCVKCHFVSSNITNAVNHAKQHGANKKYKCRHCDYSLDRKSSIANHMNSQHSQSNAFQFDMEPEKVLLKSETGQWMGGISEVSRRKFSLLDKMSIQWKKHTCVKCGFCSINPTRMLLHRLGHGRLDKEFGCEKCQYRASSARLLASHMKSHESAKATDCSCQSDLSVTRNLGISSDQKQVCERCLGLPKLSSLEISAKARDTVGPLSLEYLRARNGRKIRCGFCPFESFSALRYVIHCQHHNSLKKLSCSKCSFRANVRNVLYHHQKLHR